MRTDEEIDRDPAVLELLRPSSVSRNSATASLLSFGSAMSQNIQEEENPVLPRREYVWRIIDRGQQSLATVAHRITLDLDTNLSPLHRLTQMDGLSPHRCAGYVREEITLTTTTLDSAVVSHDTPTPLEICSICHEVVALHEAFDCICGDPSECDLVLVVAVNLRSSWIATYHQVPGVQALEPQRLRWKSEGVYLSIL
jgi:hypothetical protein